jgi:nucleoside-diphosphate-sugar epimerase
MTVLVTGAAGFLGSHLVDALVAHGERPRALVRPGEPAGPLADLGVEVHVGDIARQEVIETATNGVDEVIHCAALTGPWGPPEEYQATNVHALELLVRTALARGIRRLVHVSSITVHGNDVHGVADEDAPLQDEPNPYSRSKVAGERLLERLIHDEGAPVTIVRPGWLYGPRDRASFARIARMVDQGRMVLLGSGENHLPLIYASDAAEGLVLAARAPGAEGRAYLLVNDEPVTQRGFLAAIAGELRAPVPTKRAPYQLSVAAGRVAEGLWRLTRRSTPPPVTPYGLHLLGGDNRFQIDRARGELGFAPVIGFAEGVRRSVEWYRAACGERPKAAVGP